VTSIVDRRLRGRVAVVAGDGEEVVPVCQELLRSGVSVALIASDRAHVDRAVAGADALGIVVVPVTADPAAPEVWTRVVPHAEQRLGPIDIVVAVGPRPVRDLAAEHLIADMARRGHGVFVESDDDITPRQLPAGLSYGALPRDGALAARVLAIAGDAD
jgi:hypothetical protein